MRKQRSGLKDLTGQVFGMLTVIKYHGLTGKGRRLWLCRCECGGTSTPSTSCLNRGNSKSCGCFNAKRLPPGQASLNRYYQRYEIDCKRKDRNWNISLKDFKKITTSNCHYCGIIPLNLIKSDSSTNDTYLANGIDRIDNDKGYIIDNVVPCCRPCNIAKASMTYNEFKSKIARIYHHLKLH